MARNSAGESALHKHLRLLDAFDVRHPFLTQTRMSEITGLPISTVNRLAGELTREGLLERMPDRTYRLGVRLWEFASRTPGALGLRELARPWLGAVHERVRQHTQLGVLSGLDVLFIERMSAPDAVINATLIGSRMALYNSSNGLVLLAHAGDELVDRVIANGIRPLTSQGISTPDELRATLRRIRAEGQAVTDGFVHPESRGIAVPVFGPHRTLYASMSVVVANDGSSPAPFYELLQWAAVRTTRALEAVYLADGTPIDSDDWRNAPLFAGVSRKSLEYFAGREDGAAAEVGRPRR